MEELGLPGAPRLGQAGCLDVARFRAFLSMELGCSIEDIQALLLGGHGDDMVPLPRYSTVAGIPIAELLDKSAIDRIVARTAAGGTEITKLVGTSAWYTPGAAVVEMVEAILLDKKKILPCSVFLQGEYGIHGFVRRRSSEAGTKGIEKIIEIRLTPDEDAAFKKSASAVNELVSIINV